MVQGGLPTWADHERDVACAVAEDRAAGAAQVLRRAAGVRGPAVGEARPEHLLGGVQAAGRAAAQLHHGGRQARDGY